MPPLLTLPAVAQAVIDLSETTGAEGVTARALANELHVSVGALYNYAGSMQHAVHASEEILNQTLMQQIVGGDADPVNTLLSWTVANRGLASLYFDASRTHKSIPREMAGLFASIEAVAQPQAFEDFRVWVGLTLREGGPAHDETSLRSAAQSVLPHYAAARQRLGAGANVAVPELPFGQAELEAELQVQTSVGAKNDREAKVRLHSALLMVASDETRKWNFRALSKDSGIALAALHAMGSRDHHVQQSGVDLVSAVLTLSARHNDGIPPADHVPWAISQVLQYGVQDASSSVSWATLGSLIERLSEERQKWCSAPLLGMIFAVYIAAHHARSTDASAWVEAPQLVANLIDVVQVAASSAATA